MKIGRKSLIAIAGCLTCWMFMLVSAYDVSAGDVLIIANPSVPADTLGKDEIKNFFLGKTPQWSNQDMITIVISKDAAIHKKFLKEYIKRTPAQFTNVWRNNLFTGKGKQPVKVESVDEMVNQVSKIKGAIGYVPSGIKLLPKVKVISE